MGIILSQFSDDVCSIRTHDSNDVKIENIQHKILLFSEENIAQSFESEFNAKYQGEADPFYNCHGLTFAAKRTGIYSVSEVWKIINAEYVPIKSDRDVIVGDIIIYLNKNDETDIIHSGIVVEAKKIGEQPSIKIYSKILRAKEIIHHPLFCPYYQGFIKYYRISHANKFKRVS